MQKELKEGPGGSKMQAGVLSIAPYVAAKLNSIITIDFAVAAIDYSQQPRPSSHPAGALGMFTVHFQNITA